MKKCTAGILAGCSEGILPSVMLAKPSAGRTRHSRQDDGGTLTFMSLFNIFKISSQGMSAQRERLEAAAANLANSNTTRTNEGKHYRRRDVVFEAVDMNDAWKETSGSLFDVENQKTTGVKSKVELAPEEQFVLRYQPGHPDADADGYVKMPDVDPLEETVNMMSAARSFEANATVFNTAKELARVSLNLGDA